MTKSTLIQFFQFSLVGLFSFAIDFLAMWVFSQWIPLVFARSLAFLLAVLSNWICHRLYTFRRHKDQQAKLKEAIHFAIASLVGMIPNVGIYGWIVHSDEYLLYSSQPYAPLAAMIPGIMTAHIFNFALSKYWVFSHKKVQGLSSRPSA
ncbi:GtrA family protein [Marinomonas balearica]|uniref:Putative flippase GtrA n=1 Tax=Marinomonas balearica TaxID=491947 RepID=A0A4R6MDE5_9GAMM|nr:GtrA family protein [Marinomonas balearica]TDO99718.1 putative flippase GtrA [Marinomonas balearica]